VKSTEAASANPAGGRGARRTRRADYVTNSYLNGKQAVALGIFQRPGTNALAASEDPAAMMRDLSSGFPAGPGYDIVYNPTEFIAESINEVYKTIGEAVVLVVVVIIVFLQSWRTAIVPIVAIPVSLIGTFAVLYAFGFSLNMLTLFGLVLAIGIVVDDAIVVVENVERNIALGMSRAKPRTRRWTRSASLCSPSRWCSSRCSCRRPSFRASPGQFYLQFAMTIAVSTAISAFNSLTLSPALAAVLLKPHHNHPPVANPVARFGRSLAERLQSRLRQDERRLCLKRVPCGRRLMGRRCWRCSPFSRRCSCDLLHAADGAARLHSAHGPGLCDRRRATARRRIARPHRRGHPAGLENHPEEPGVANSVAFAGFSGATFTNASNARASSSRLRYVRTAAGGPPPSGVIGELFGRLQIDPGSLHHRGAAAARAGHRQFRRFQDAAGRSATAPTCGRSWRLPIR
jgi:HAE1 family hydrophobic/amphiphilic exporter-1